MPSFTSPRRLPRRTTFAAIAILALLAGCSTLGLGPRQVTLSEAELARVIARQFPAERRLLEVIDVRLTAPRLKLLPESNRVATDVAVEASARGMPKRYQGRIALDYGLRWDAPSQSVRLTGVRVNSLTLDNVPPSMQPAVDRLGPLIAEQLLRDLPVYRLRPEDLQLAESRGYAPSAINVTAKGLEITLSPSAQ